MGIHQTARGVCGLRLALAVLVILVSVVTATGTASASHKHQQCGRWHPAVGVWHRKQVIKCWARKRQVGPEKAFRVARCESGEDLLDDHVGGSDLYGGTFQHDYRYWLSRARHYKAWRDEPGHRHGVRNVWAQAKVSTAMARDFGWATHWPVCGHV